MKKVKKTIQECRENIQAFANEHKLIFNDEGECGFGRECVGLNIGEKWLDYNPHNSTTYESIKEYYDQRFYEVAPTDAYHKHDCVAVLGRGDEAIRQLSDWVDKLNELGVEVVEYRTGATGMQVMFSGFISRTLKIKEENDER